MDATAADAAADVDGLLLAWVFFRLNPHENGAYGVVVMAMFDWVVGLDGWCQHRDRAAPTVEVHDGRVCCQFAKG